MYLFCTLCTLHKIKRLDHQASNDYVGATINDVIFLRRFNLFKPEVLQTSGHHDWVYT